MYGVARGDACGSEKGALQREGVVCGDGVGDERDGTLWLCGVVVDGMVAVSEMANLHRESDAGWMMFRLATSRVLAANLVELTVFWMTRRESDASFRRSPTRLKSASKAAFDEAVGTEGGRVNTQRSQAELVQTQAVGKEECEVWDGLGGEDADVVK